jgi:hypothetical protein
VKIPTRPHDVTSLGNKRTAMYRTDADREQCLRENGPSIPVFQGAFNRDHARHGGLGLGLPAAQRPQVLQVAVGDGVGVEAEGAGVCIG